MIAHLVFAVLDKGFNLKLILFFPTEFHCNGVETSTQRLLKLGKQLRMKDVDHLLPGEAGYFGQSCLYPLFVLSDALTHLLQLDQGANILVLPEELGLLKLLL